MIVAPHVNMEIGSAGHENLRASISMVSSPDYGEVPPSLWQTCMYSLYIQTPTFYIFDSEDEACHLWPPEDYE